MLHSVCTDRQTRLRLIIYLFVVPNRLPSLFCAYKPRCFYCSERTDRAGFVYYSILTDQVSFTILYCQTSFLDSIFGDHTHTYTDTHTHTHTHKHTHTHTHTHTQAHTPTHTHTHTHTHAQCANLQKRRQACLFSSGLSLLLFGHLRRLQAGLLCRALFRRKELLKFGVGQCRCVELLPHLADGAPRLPRVRRDSPELVVRKRSSSSVALHWSASLSFSSSLTATKPAGGFGKLPEINPGTHRFLSSVVSSPCSRNPLEPRRTRQAGHVSGCHWLNARALRHIPA